MQSSRLTLHFQSIPGWARDWVQRALRNGGELWVKWINPNEQNPFGEYKVRVVGRVHPDDNRWAKACPPWWAPT